jgi:DNA-binding transcriptional LysR family regulator
MSVRISVESVSGCRWNGCPDGHGIPTQAGRGIACVPDFAVKDSLADGRLEKVLSSSLVGGTTFHVVWPSSRQMAPKVRAFVDFAVENFSKGLVI